MSFTIDYFPVQGGNVEHCFNIYDGKKALLVAAANREEKLQWMEDIEEAARAARAEDGSKAANGTSNGGSQNKFMSMKSISGSEDGLSLAEQVNCFHGSSSMRFP